MIAEKQKILIVDDVWENRKFLEKILMSNNNYEIKSAEDGKNALEIIEWFIPDCILLDIMMPVIDGFQVAEQLKTDARFKNIPILFITGLDDIESKIKGFQIGGADYIAKPFNKYELVARVESQLKIKKAYDNYKNYLIGIFGRYVSTELAAEILSQKSIVKGEKRICTVFFTDIQNYTQITDGMDPVETVDLLNDYFSVIVDIINRNKGIVNKFIGDALLAVFNAGIEDSEHPQNAVKAAEEIIEYCNANSFRKNIFLHTRIGIDTGEVIIGNIGSKERLEYTVIGEAVNIAARLEKLNKNYNSQILLGENTYNLVKDSCEFELIPDVQLRGKKKVINVYKKQREENYERI